MDRDPDFPWSVDIPIPPAGMGSMLTVIFDAAKACSAGARVSAYGRPPTAQVQAWFNRISTKTPDDARRLAKTFESIGARIVQ